MENDSLLHPGEAARMLGVDPKTLQRWAKAKKIPSVRTLGGHRRYWTSDIEKILNNDN